MLPNYAYYVVALASTVAASPLAARGMTCWSGEIHSSCDGFATGCTPDGFKVVCQDDLQMIFSATCGPLMGGPSTCHYDADCNASC
ncbi:hypothetical protein MGN70_013404 [Eutypa lata]|nr:hypothetical protein MGN70_013404 [Eutypa lata]